MPDRISRLFCFCFAVYLCSCRSEQARTISFYYWDPVFVLDSAEGNTLRNNDVHTLYVHYFDVDWTAADTAPLPKERFNYRSSPAGYSIIPVICIRNQVFEKIASGSIPTLASDIFAWVRGINETRHLTNDLIEFDCDWTPKTRDAYFDFLKEYHRLSVQTVSAAIRMAQLRDPGPAGVPPVDYGVLLYFNLEESDSGDETSIYDRAIAHRYTPSLRAYPLTLDVALPLFSGRSERNGEDLFEIVSDINRHSNHHIRNLIFFDLDRQNLLHYNPDVFKETLARFD